jgi:DNA invertase Pin-like site-specific DNA recombinase
MKAAVYLRVSKQDQDEANQEPDCRRLCDARGWEPLIFAERESGTRADRPQWRALIEAARRGQVGAVVFWCLDRTGRTRTQIVHDIAELGRFGVHLTSVQDAWLDQPAGPLRDLLVQIMAWVAEGERRRLVERTVAGQARARAQGKRIGRPRRHISGPALIRAGVLRAEGRSWADCAKALVREGLAAPGLTSAPLRRACRNGVSAEGGKAA